jgi:hypothetical protein
LRDEDSVAGGEVRVVFKMMLSMKWNEMEWNGMDGNKQSL